MPTLKNQQNNTTPKTKTQRQLSTKTKTNSRKRKPITHILKNKRKNNTKKN